MNAIWFEGIMNAARLMIDTMANACGDGGFDLPSVEISPAGAVHCRDKRTVADAAAIGHARLRAKKNRFENEAWLDTQTGLVLWTAPMLTYGVRCRAKAALAAPVPEECHRLPICAPDHLAGLGVTHTYIEDVTPELWRELTDAGAAE